MYAGSDAPKIKVGAPPRSRVCVLAYPGRVFNAKTFYYVRGPSLRFRPLAPNCRCAPENPQPLGAVSFCPRCSPPFRALLKRGVQRGVRAKPS